MRGRERKGRKVKEGRKRKRGEEGKVRTLKAARTSSLLVPTAAPVLEYRLSRSNRCDEMVWILVSREGRGSLITHVRQ